ncbi:MAG: two-component regulator propeller domain-containing protein [Pyrinomonadaceae bacterium]|jgi:ligand-binding sensor domain-containing protein
MKRSLLLLATLLLCSALARAQNLAIRTYRVGDGLAHNNVNRIFQDAKGFLWIGTRHHGALVTDEPNAAMPRFRRYTMADGLASDTVWAITEDDDGRIYFGTGRGIDQLDPTTNKIHHFTPDEGAVSAGINYLLKDRRGNVWAASANGKQKAFCVYHELRSKPDASQQVGEAWVGAE